MYTPESGEVLSDAKLMRILDRVPVLAAYFKHYVEGKSKMDAQEIVANGSLYFALWIGQMAKEFIIDKARRQVTQYEDVDGVSTPNRLHILVPKKRYQFGKFNMGQNRRVQSIMQDQKIRARATVWLRINSKKIKGKPKMKSVDFLRYLQTDLLRGKKVVNVSPPYAYPTMMYYYSLLCVDREIKPWFSYAFLKSLG